MFTGTSISNFTYHWYDTNGYIMSGDSIFILTTNTYSYYGVIASNVFCVSTIAYDSVQVIPYPILTASNDTVACENSVITLSSQSSYLNYSWNTGSTNSTISVNQNGTYWVSSQNGNCIITDSINVSIISCDDLAINVFTPNGDGTNDIFIFKSKAIKDIHCEIRNRWGEKMSEFNGKENGWNGKNIFNNKECEAGTYFYIAELLTIEGLSKKINGFITLIR